jgi:hypothetical protein
MNPKNIYDRIKRNVGKVATTGLITLVGAGCSEDKYSEPVERLALKGIIRGVDVWPQSQRVAFKIDVLKDLGHDNPNLHPDEPTWIELEEELCNLSPVYPLNIGDTVVVVLTDGFAKRDSIEQTGFYSSINRGTFYRITSWPVEGKITHYSKGENNQ